ncbi:MAG: 1-acyl-sn-glycerol-3-phosphate acyltransferase [Treponemataceae bacterium]|nr:1-acyl-sn-glycerol-3-phosphate acyltransferase [Treponemataceae bacterium]
MSENINSELTKRGHTVQEGVYIPETGFTYPEAPDIPLWNPKAKEVIIDENYPFFDKSFLGRLQNYRIYAGAWALAFPLNKIRYGLKVVGREKIKQHKDLLKNGCITICNHVYRWDFLAVLEACKWRRMWVIVKPSNLGTSDCDLIRGIGGIPLPDGIHAGHKFNETLDYLHKRKKWIHVFPESCRWDFYEPIRPFKKGAFVLAQKWNAPILPMVISYKKPTGFLYEKILKPKHPLITITVGDPITPRSDLSRKENIHYLRETCHKKMVEMAGIKNNCWQCDGD